MSERLKRVMKKYEELETALDEAIGDVMNDESFTLRDRLAIVMGVLDNQYSKVLLIKLDTLQGNRLKTFNETMSVSRSNIIRGMRILNHESPWPIQLDNFK